MYEMPLTQFFFTGADCEIEKTAMMAFNPEFGASYLMVDGMVDDDLLVHQIQP
jgi:hypothetical protein